MFAFGANLDKPATQGALESLRQFSIAGNRVLSALPPEDKRSINSGIRILQAYFKRYADDGFVVAKDTFGNPYIERKFTFRLYTDPTLSIDYFGTIDVILENKTTGLIMVADHKTTSMLGKEFYDRCRPNPQYTGYVLGAQQSLNVNTNLFMINGIQTAKTKTEFARQVTERTEDDFNELRYSVVHHVTNWLRLNNVGIFPQTAPNPCSMYGGCQYRKICEVPNKLKNNVIKAEYGEVE